MFKNAKLLQSCRETKWTTFTSFLPPKGGFLSCWTFQKPLILHQGTTAIRAKYKEIPIVFSLCGKFYWAQECLSSNIWIRMSVICLWVVDKALVSCKNCQTQPNYQQILRRQFYLVCGGSETLIKIPTQFDNTNHKGNPKQYGNASGATFWS